MTQLENSYTISEATAFLCALRFCNQLSVSRSSKCIEVKNFASNNKHQLLGVSHILGSVQRKNSLQDQVQSGITVKVQL